VKHLRAILHAIIRLFLRALLGTMQPTAEDADPDRALRDRLRAKVRKHWMIVLAPMMLAGCVCTTPRTIYVPDGTPVRLRETVHNAKVWVKDANGDVVPGVMDLPDGWYCLSADTEDE
jgi:hypothetical protein